MYFNAGLRIRVRDGRKCSVASLVLCRLMCMYLLNICISKPGVADPSPVPEIIDTVFAKTSPIRSFSMTEYERFGLVFTKTRVSAYGHGMVENGRYLVSDCGD